MKSPHTPYRGRPVLRWGGAVTLALGVTAFWFTFLSTSWPEPRSDVQSASRIAWRMFPPVTKENPVLDVLTLRSPSLFALPSPAGFSRPVLAETIGHRPPVHGPVETAMVLTRTMRPLVQGPAVTADPLADRTRMVTSDDAIWLRPSTVRREPPPPVMPLVSKPLRPLIEPGFDWTERKFEKQVIPEGAALWGPTSWEAEAYLRVDEEGAVQQVLLDRRTADMGVNERLVRMIRAWRLAPAATATSGRLLLRYRGVPEQDVNPPEMTP